MATTDHTSDLVDEASEFFRRYYHDDIAQLAQEYPDDTQSLAIDWMDLFKYDPDLADDFRQQPGTIRESLSHALAEFELPVDIDLSGAAVRVHNKTINRADIDRARRLIGRSMSDVGMDPDSGVLDADIIGTGQPESQRERIEWVYDTIQHEEDADPVGHETLVDLGREAGLDRGDVEYAIEKLKRQKKVYEPETDGYRISGGGS